jgi:hypothetical protein
MERRVPSASQSRPSQRPSARCLTPPDPYRRRAIAAPPREQPEGAEPNTLGGQIGGRASGRSSRQSPARLPNPLEIEFKIGAGGPSRTAYEHFSC